MIELCSYSSMKILERDEDHIESALATASSHFEGILSGERRYGWREKSVGSKIILRSGETFWLRLQRSPVDEKINKRNWEGELQASGLANIRKPVVHAYYDWTSDAYHWRATLMTFIESETCSPTPELRCNLHLSARWLAYLRSSLAALSVCPTDRISCRQDLVTRRLRERFGEAIDPTIDEWTTCHGDMHWANLTCPDLYILDWEGWGLGPKGLDPAFLLGYSLLQPDVAQIIATSFRDKLESTSGKKSILFVYAELLRVIELHQDHPDLEKPLQQLATKTLASIKEASRG